VGSRGTYAGSASRTNANNPGPAAAQFSRKLLYGIDRTSPKAIFLDGAWPNLNVP